MTKENNFKYLTEKADDAFGYSYGQLKEKYNNYPMCLIEYIDKDDHEECIEIIFDNENASITFFFFDNEEKKCRHSSIYFHDAKDEDLFICFLNKTADHYSYRKNCWIFKNYFCVKLKEGSYGTHFYCYKS